MMFIPLRKVSMEAGVVGEVVCDGGSAMQCGVAQMSFIRKSRIPFQESMRGIVAESLQSLCDLNVHVFVQVDSDT